MQVLVIKLPFGLRRMQEWWLWADKGWSTARVIEWFWEVRANCGVTLAIFFHIHVFVFTLTHSLIHMIFFLMEGEAIAPYQDEDSRLHHDWLQSKAAANTGEGTGSEPGSGRPIAQRDLFEFDRGFFDVGHSGGNQSRGSRGTRGSQGNSGHRGRTGRGPSSGSSTSIHAPTRGLKRAANSEKMEEGSTASGSQSKRKKNRGKRDKCHDEV